MGGRSVAVVWPADLVYGCNVVSGDAPYRSAIAKPRVAPRPRRGRAQLELAPQYTQLDIDGKLVCTITDRFVTVQEIGRRKTKPRSRALDGAKLAVALSFPGHEVAI